MLSNLSSFSKHLFAVRFKYFSHANKEVEAWMGYRSPSFSGDVYF